MSTVTKITQPYKRQDKPLTVILSLAILMPLGAAVSLVSLLFLPWGLLGIVLGIILMGAGFSSLIKTALCACPHCGNQIRVPQKAKVFRCNACGRKVSKVGERLEGI